MYANCDTSVTLEIKKLEIFLVWFGLSSPVNIGQPT